MDFDFIRNAVIDDDIWAVAWRYSGLQLKVPAPPKVDTVREILDMWDRLEESFDALSATDKARVEAEAYLHGPPRFLGFDGNNETDLLHIARLLVNHLDYRARFKGRDLNSHAPIKDVYGRLLAVWRPMRDRSLTADEMISVHREEIHPEHRKSKPGGDWTFDRSKLERRRS